MPKIASKDIWRKILYGSPSKCIETSGAPKHMLGLAQLGSSHKSPSLKDLISLAFMTKICQNCSRNCIKLHEIRLILGSL